MKKWKKPIVCVATSFLLGSSFVAGGGLFTPVAAHAASLNYSVTASVLNVRRGPGTAYTVFGTVSYGQPLSVIEKEFNGWYKIDYKSTTGYVSGKYVSTSTSKTVKSSVFVNNGTLNVRRGAGTTYGVIGTVGYGERLSVLGQTNGWYKINYNDTTGYVSGKYVNAPYSTKFVNVKSVDKDIIVDLRYNTTNNFTKKRVYNFDQAILRTSTAKKLASANAILKKQGYTLKVWDAYRPLYAQEALWNADPNPIFVMYPNPNYIQNHQLGVSVDITLCNLKTGHEMPMQSGFDEFNSKAYRSYERTLLQEKYYQILNNAMTKVGFVGYSKEWWHYNDTNSNYLPLEVDPSLY